MRLLNLIVIDAHLIPNGDGERNNLKNKITMSDHSVFLMPHATSKLNQRLPRDMCHCRSRRVSPILPFLPLFLGAR